MDTDTTLFGAVDQYVDVKKFIDQQIATRADLAGTPVWMTENNVNADFAGNNGTSSCNAGQTFVVDPRGTSAYFAAWRPYVFSQFGKAGNQALYQWDYSGDKQYGEVDANGNPYLSYWVDRALATFYPSTAASPGPDILTATSTDTSSIETLATRASNGSGSRDDRGQGGARRSRITTAQAIRAP